MYRVSRKNCEKIAAPISSAVMFEADSVRSLKIRNGSNGAFERISMTTNPTISAADRASSPIVSAVTQPCWLARVSAYTSTISPPVIDAAPAVSKRR